MIRNLRSGESHKIPQLFTTDSLQFDKGKFKGKVCIISYFQTWCSDCVKEQPELKKLSELFGPDSLLIAMISDEPLYKINAFRNRFDSGLKFYKTNTALKKDLGISGFPTTYLLDKKGNVVIMKVEGINWYTPEIIARIRELLRN